MAGRGDGARGEALSLSWQGGAGGDSEEVRFVVGIHFPWLSRGGAVGLSNVKGTQPSLLHWGWGRIWMWAIERDSPVRAEAEMGDHTVLGQRQSI